MKAANKAIGRDLLQWGHLRDIDRIISKQLRICQEQSSNSSVLQRKIESTGKRKEQKKEMNGESSRRPGIRRLCYGFYEKANA